MERRLMAIPLMARDVAASFADPNVSIVDRSGAEATFRGRPN